MSRPTTSPEADVYRELVAASSSASRRGRLLKRGALGITTLALAGWVWRRNKDRKPDRAGASPSVSSDAKRRE